MCDSFDSSNWFVALEKKMKNQNLQKRDISYSKWVSEKDGKKICQVLKQQKCNIISFIDSVLF